MSGHVQPPVAPQPGSGMIVAVVVPVLAFLILIPALLFVSWYCNTPEIIWKNCKRKTTKKKKKTKTRGKTTKTKAKVKAKVEEEEEEKEKNDDDSSNGEASEKPNLSTQKVEIKPLNTHEKEKEQGSSAGSSKQKDSESGSNKNVEQGPGPGNQGQGQGPGPGNQGQNQEPGQVDQKKDEVFIPLNFQKTAAAVVEGPIQDDARLGIQPDHAYDFRNQPLVYAKIVHQSIQQEVNDPKRIREKEIAERINERRVELAIQQAQERQHQRASRPGHYRPQQQQQEAAAAANVPNHAQAPVQVANVAPQLPITPQDPAIDPHFQANPRRQNPAVSMVRHQNSNERRTKYENPYVNVNLVTNQKSK